jgi:DNA-binding GntR family transcriptional regulator
MRPLNVDNDIVLMDCNLDRQSYTPFYQQIKNWIVGKISQGDLSFGDVIPSEHQLAAAFRVSRATVRQALYELRVEGYVIREKGRGTFVKIEETVIPTEVRCF